MKLKSDMGPQGWVSHAACEQPYGLHPLKPKVARDRQRGGGYCHNLTHQALEFILQILQPGLFREGGSGYV